MANLIIGINQVELSYSDVCQALHQGLAFLGDGCTQVLLHWRRQEALSSCEELL